MAILIKNEWPSDAKLVLQASGVEHEFDAGDSWWIEGDELKHVLGPVNQGTLVVGYRPYTDNPDCGSGPLATIKVRDNLSYTFELPEGIAPKHR